MQRKKNVDQHVEEKIFKHKLIRKINLLIPVYEKNLFLLSKKMQLLEEIQPIQIFQFRGLIF